jgi:hypothetical protein
MLFPLHGGNFLMRNCWMRTVSCVNELMHTRNAQVYFSVALLLSPSDAEFVSNCHHQHPVSPLPRPFALKQLKKDPWNRSDLLETTLKSYQTFLKSGFLQAVMWRFDKYSPYSPIHGIIGDKSTQDSHAVTHSIICKTFYGPYFIPCNLFWYSFINHSVQMV